MLNAAVIGLGKAGSRFDEEPRPGIWSHVGAYLAAADKYRLSGGADIDPLNRQRFTQRCPDAQVFEDAAEMVSHAKPDVISVCTPAAGRYDLVMSILAAHRPKVLICEKPLEMTQEKRQRLVAACRDRGISLMVNYNRRYASIYRRAREAVEAQLFGPLTSITVHAPNRLWSIGSHSVDIMFYLTGEAPVEWRALQTPQLCEAGEPSCDVLCRFPSGIAGRIATVGFSDMLVFNVDLFGKDGSLSITDNGSTSTLRRFRESPQYLGYRVLDEGAVFYESSQSESTFETLVREAADIAEGRRKHASCTGEDALASESMLDALAAECTT